LLQPAKLAADASAVDVSIPANLRHRLDLYIRQCGNLEVSGLGTVEVRSGILEVTDLYLLEQEVSVGETELSALSVAQFLASAAGQGIDHTKVRLWWHSHGSMESFWSATDDKTIDGFDHVPWWLSIVGNSRGDYLGRVDVYPNEAVPLRLTHPARLYTSYVAEEVERVRDEVNLLVHEAKKPAATRGKVSRPGVRRVTPTKT